MWFLLPHRLFLALVFPIPSLPHFFPGFFGGFGGGVGWALLLIIDLMFQSLVKKFTNSHLSVSMDRA